MHIIAQYIYDGEDLGNPYTKHSEKTKIENVTRCGAYTSPLGIHSLLIGQAFKTTHTYVHVCQN